MIEIRRILCPVDFSDFSRRAFDHAVAIAKWYDATVTVFHVCAPVPVTAYANPVSMMPSTLVAGENLDAVLAAMKTFVAIEGTPDVPVEFAIGDGATASEIIAKADAIKTDLIVLGTHGRSGFQRLILGSVTERVLRKASCPVLSVPPRAPETAPVPSSLFKRIVCAVDFSDCSMRALDYAMSMAQESDSKLVVLHVIELPAGVPNGGDEFVPGGMKSLTDYVVAAQDDVSARLKNAVPASVRSYCTVDTIQTVGKPYREILRVAAATPTDLIVIGVHGRGPADLMFFGSTAQHVVRQAMCPVLTMRTE